jgi:two-component system cell cycle sensor histidine kinase/response regulator CckA
MNNDNSRKNMNDRPKEEIENVLQIVSRHEQEIEKQLSEHFQASAFENRYTLHPRRLAEIGKEFLAEFVTFLKEANPDICREWGKRAAIEGINHQPLHGVVHILRKYFSDSDCSATTLEVAQECIDAYIGSLLDAYIEEREAQILKDQEQMRLALSTALERQRRELYIKNHAIHTSISGIILCDLEGNITYANPAILGMLDLSTAKDLVSRPCFDYWGDQGKHVFSVLLETGGWQGEISIPRTEQNSLEVAVSASVIRDAKDTPIGIISFYYDISERKHLEAQFRQAQKMEALGQLAGGIVHDFNNLLTAISGYSQLALLELPEDSKTYQDFVQIKTATDRGRELTQELRMFTRQTSSKREPLSLNSIVEEIHKLLRRTFPPEIKIIMKLDPELSGINANASQMSQMLMNLCVNARDAIMSSLKKNSTNSEKHGQLTIKSFNIELDWRTASRFLHAQPGRYVCLSISDSGGGIPQKNLDHLFEPFFTTKGEKTGTGLGLAVVYGIVQNHNGFIDVHSKEGSGSIFNIYLPVIEADELEEPNHSYIPDLTVGKGTILVAEDNPQVQGMIVRALEESGYSVITAKDGSDAIAIYEKRGPDIDLVILDMLMPHVGGRDCFYMIKEIDAQARILLMTGFTANDSMEDFLDEGAAGVITKPFELQHFTATIRKALGENQKKPGKR